MSFPQFPGIFLKLWVYKNLHREKSSLKWKVIALSIKAISNLLTTGKKVISYYIESTNLSSIRVLFYMSSFKYNIISVKS